MPAGVNHIVFAEKFDREAVRRMEQYGRVTHLESCDEESLRSAVSDCDALLIRSVSRITRTVFNAANHLRVIGRGGVGLENVDLQAAAEKGVVVVHTPAAATDAVADLTVGLIIALVRNLVAGDKSVRAGEFQSFRDCVRSRELAGLTIGIVGLGRIGRAVARRCRHGFDMTVLYNDIVSPGWTDFVGHPVSKEELYGRSDIISLHVPLTDQTRHMITERTLGHFKSGAVLINTSRGAVVDGAALAEALCAGRIAGAALDVFDPEPIPAKHPLMHAPNTLFTPHIGARTHAGLARMNAVVEDVIRVLTGERPHYRYSP